MSLALSSGQRRGGVGLGGSLQLVMLGELAGGSWGASLARTYKKQTLMILLRIAERDWWWKLPADSCVIFPVLVLTKSPAVPGIYEFPCKF